MQEKTNRFLKVKNGLLQLENHFMRLKGAELKDRELKIKKKQNKYFLNQSLCLQMIWIDLNKKK